MTTIDCYQTARYIKEDDEKREPPESPGLMVRFLNELGSVSPTIVRRVVRAAFLRLVLPLAGWMIVYCFVVHQGSVAERTFHLSLAAGSLRQLCDRLCDPQRLWGDEVNIEGFTLPNTRVETVWKLDASGGAPIEGLSLFSVSFSVRQSERGCHVLRDAVLCVGQTVFCFRSVANTTLVVPQGRTAGANVTQVVKLNLPKAYAMFHGEETMRVHETMFKMSLLDSGEDAKRL